MLYAWVGQWDAKGTKSELECVRTMFGGSSNPRGVQLLRYVSKVLLDLEQGADYRTVRKDFKAFLTKGTSYHGSWLHSLHSRSLPVLTRTQPGCVPASTADQHDDCVDALPLGVPCAACFPRARGSTAWELRSS